MTEKNELQHRYEAKKKQIEQQIAEAKADASSARNEEKERLESQLQELKSSASETWDNMSEQAAKKVNDLLERF